MTKFNILYKSVAAFLLAAAFFACEGNYEEIQQLRAPDVGPVAEGEGVNLKYTDSGKLVANLITPRLLDFSHYDFGYSEFPDGLEVQFWDEEGKKNTITSDYGIHFENTGLLDLRGNVRLVTSDSLILDAGQLYWDQKNKWVFTDRPYRIKFKDGSFNDGARFDSSEDFDNFISRKNVGVQMVDNKTQDEQNGL